MTDLVEFLRARLDEDEQVARAANVKQDDPEWWVSPVALTAGAHFTVRSKRDNRPIARVQRLDGDEDEPAGILDGEATAGHIARWDPARVLAEVAAKRAIIDAYLPDEDRVRLGDFESCVDSCPGYIMRQLFQVLAQPYADHPDFDESWRS